MQLNKNFFNIITDNLPNLDTPFIKTAAEQNFSYIDMIRLSGKYANALTKLGIRKKSRIMLQTEKKIECVWLYLACLRIGAIFVTINPSYTKAETEFFLKDTEPSLFVTDKRSRFVEINNILSKKSDTQVVQLTAREGRSLSKLVATSEESFENSDCDGTDIAAILYTSGTTGRSKGAMITHENLSSNAKALAEIWNFTAVDTLLHILPIYHTHGLFVAFNTVMVSGSSILFEEKFEVDRILKIIRQATVMMGVPTHYTRLLGNKAFSAQLTKNIRLFVSGSAPLSFDTHRKFEERTNHKILERYGMTETNMITSNPYNGLRKPRTVGFALPDVKVRVTSLKTKKIVENGVIGNIEVQGPNVFKGYWKLEEKTNLDFTDDNFFITGDLGFIDADGYLNLSGRGKDLIISGGLNVYPAEIEQTIDSLPEILESAVIGLPHQDFGEGVTAVVTTEQNMEFDESQLRVRLKEKLAGFKIPLKIIRVETLPRNSMGKIEKGILRDLFKNEYHKW